MLKGFANDNRGFMNRTRAINQNFANAIGTTTYVKPSPTPPINAIPSCTGHTASKACMSCAGGGASGCPQSAGNYAVDWEVSEYAGQQCGCSYNPPLLGGKKPTSFTTTAVKFDGGFANAYGNPVQKATRPLIYSPYANAVGTRPITPLPDRWKTTKKVPLGYANAIGSTKLIDPKILGYTPKKCTSGSCPTGLCCLKGGTLVTTGETADWCISCSEFQKFDGGFANAYGNPVQKATRPLVNNPYKNANGGCGCGCSDNGFLGL